ncbi:MAG: hypothetical protein IPP10_16635 [Candidatus Competibacteraceae bacterium]|nr:hypothetical protein [Candidatus Competibacteraceae bacterium]MBK7984978.1 hypothetical protein [Candidatus Competibacteraceae bacterium]MBK8895939.1 hypothetical protein [Candidatus Competibacteraceae bacterium]MBK8963029.1 hypothetical protein [Candidatus Competibacteraceae bacterium]MBK9953035.1 hypothetical protein [Candidatus Competibacteraceae bacterium]
MKTYKASSHHTGKSMVWPLFFLATSAVAAPAIQQASVSSESITLSGSGFGSKATARPLIFDNFDSGTNGQSIPGHAPTMTLLSSGGWKWDSTTAGGTALPVYSTANQRPGSVANALSDMNDNQWNKSLSVSSQQSEYFASWWMYYDHYAGSVSRNTKPWVMYGSNQDEPHTYSGWGDLNDSSLRSSIADTNYSDPNTAYGDPGTPNFYGKWFKFELYLKQSSPNVANGIYKVWITEPGQPRKLALNRDPVVTRSISGVWSQFTFIGAYCDSSPGDRKYKIYADDFYLDNTQARVEIGNASTYDASTIREVQPANSWSTTQISTTLNKGALPYGTAYIYVIDSTGSVNNVGYPITLTSSGSKNQLSPPVLYLK